MITALNEIALQQLAPTAETMKISKQLLDYCVSQENAIMTSQKSDTKLAGHSDAGYLKKKKECSRAGGTVTCFLQIMGPC